MPKICDPPQFTGGQKHLFRYNISFDLTVYRIVYGNPYTLYYPNNFRSWGQEPQIYGELSNYRTAVKINGGSGYGVYITCNSATGERREVELFGGSSFGVESIEVSNFLAIPFDGSPDSPENPPSDNCYCSNDSCRVDCASSPNGFCCIDHSVTDRLLQVLQN